MANWKMLAQFCAGVGAAMSAAQISLVDVFPFSVVKVYAAVQAAIIALGLYAMTQVKPEITVQEVTTDA